MTLNAVLMTLPLFSGFTGISCPVSPEHRDDFLTEELQRGHDLLVRGAARMAKANDEVVRPHLAVPHLDFLDAVLGGAEDQAVEGDALEVEVVLLRDVLIVGAVSPVVPMCAQKTGFVILDGLLPRGSYEAFSEDDDLLRVAPS